MYYKVTETATINALQNIIVGNLKNFQRIFKGNYVHTENLWVCIMVCVLALHLCVFCFNFILLKN